MSHYNYEKLAKERVPAKRVNIVSIKQSQLVVCKESSILYEGREVSNPTRAAELLNHFLLDNDREQMVVISLNSKNEPINMSLVSVGSLSTAIAHPREIFKIAVKSNANTLLLGHSHPSGNTTPSGADIDITQKLIEAGEVIGIPVLDHLIIGGQDNFISMKEEGYFQ